MDESDGTTFPMPSGGSMENTQVSRPLLDAVCLHKSLHRIRAGGSDSKNRMCRRSSLVGKAYQVSTWTRWPRLVCDCHAIARKRRRV